MNDRLLRALRREPVDQAPVWIMRQAGRYLPEYRKIRSSVTNFMALCQSPELACEVTLQPLRRFDLDAAIVFSDILTIPDAMGLGLSFVAGEGPRFKNPLKTESDIAALRVPRAATDLAYVGKAIRLIKPEIKIPLIGFSGSPWTLACYMLEGEGSKSFTLARQWIYKNPEALHHLCELLSQSIIDYLQMQIDAGADVLMLFDTWGGLLSKEQYAMFSLNYMTKIIAALKKQVPVILFTKGAGESLALQMQSGADALGLDWMHSMKQARSCAQGKITLQGNLDPCALYAPPALLKKNIDQLLAEVGDPLAYIFNLGHGIEPDVDPAQVKIVVDYVHEVTRREL